MDKMALFCDYKFIPMSTHQSLVQRISQSRLVIHLLFWVSSVLMMTYIGSLFSGELVQSFQYMLSLLPCQMLAAYLLVYYQIPQWLMKGSWLRFLLISGVVAYLIAALARLSNIYIAEPLMGIDGIDESVWEVLTDPIYLARVYVVSAYIPAGLFFLFKMTKERFAAENRMVALEKEKQTTELNFLKAQINPHFLFNTLNNIYALAKAKSDDTPEMILKLSEILDYTIYECQSDRVAIGREWTLIENYADLQALRHHDQMTIILNQEIEDEDVLIAPLILISLVENAFKHGLKGKREGATIDISLVQKGSQLDCKVYNTRTAPDANNKMGIGMQNIRRQLDLQYQDSYDMEIEEHEGSYKVILSIALK